ncbi:MAG: beta-galactosidase [Verrucomicrobiota bacterium]
MQTYVLWNFHEAQKGQIDFSTGARDLAAFLQTAQDVGLYATVRVGPYDCAEWDSGGYPVWLRFVPGLKVRMDNAPFLEAVDAFWDKLLPIVAAHQIHRGGNVVLVQLENEHPDGWGTDMPNAYFTHLQKKALDLGIEVPYSSAVSTTTPIPPATCRGTAPGARTRGTPPRRGSAGTTPTATATRTRWPATRATSGTSSPTGQRLQPLHVPCGTNFDFFNNDEDAASYDYGTLVGEAGDLRNLYYSVRRAGTFATSFPDILANSTDATGALRALP